MTKKRRALSMTESMYFALSEYTNQLNEELVSEMEGNPKPAVGLHPLESTPRSSSEIYLRSPNPV